MNYWLNLWWMEDEKKKTKFTGNYIIFMCPVLAEHCSLDSRFEITMPSQDICFSKCDVQNVSDILISIILYWRPFLTARSKVTRDNVDRWTTSRECQEPAWLRTLQRQKKQNRLEIHCSQPFVGRWHKMMMMKSWSYHLLGQPLPHFPETMPCITVLNSPSHHLMWIKMDKLFIYIHV